MMPPLAPIGKLRSWIWAILQLGYMIALAYSMALLTCQGLRLLGA